MASPMISLSNIRGFGSPDIGAFKASGELFGWKNKRTGEIFQYNHQDISHGVFTKTSHGFYQLRLQLNENKNNLIARFDGFTERSMAEITTHFAKYFNIDVPRQEVTSKGWHWGEYDFKDSSLLFKIDNKPALEIDVNNIAQVTIPSKGDLAIELKTNMDRNILCDQLLEVRFCIPKAESEDLDLNLENLKQDLLERSGLGDVKSASIALFTNVPAIVPRGRFELDFGRKGVKFHGKSYDFSLQYLTVSKMFLLPKPHSPHVLFVIGLDTPVRQGQTKYPYLVLQFDHEQETELQLNVTKEEADSLKLEQDIKDKTYNVITKLFSSLVNKQIITPHEFKSSNDQFAVGCSYRAGSGHLFPLRRSILFIVKPILFFRNEDVVSVDFLRTGLATHSRFFSVTIQLKGGSSYEFTNIDKNEYQLLSNYFSNNGLKVKFVEEASNFIQDDDLEEEEDEEEEDADYEDGADENEGGESEDDDEEEEDDGADEDDEENL